MPEPAFNFEASPMLRAVEQGPEIVDVHNFVVPAKAGTQRTPVTTEAVCARWHFFF
jgi:hypothetical protein